MSFGTDPSTLVDVLKLGSASSQALTLLNTMVTLDLTADTLMARGLAGAAGLTALLHRLNP